MKVYVFVTHSVVLQSVQFWVWIMKRSSPKELQSGNCIATGCKDPVGTHLAARFVFNLMQGWNAPDRD